MAAYTTGKVMLFFLLILILGLSIGNAVYFGRMSETKEADPKVSKSSANTWMWINIIIIVIVLISCFILGFFIYNDLKSPEKKKEILINGDVDKYEIEILNRKKLIDTLAEDIKTLDEKKLKIEKADINKRSAQRIRNLAASISDDSVLFEAVREVEIKKEEAIRNKYKESQTKRNAVEAILKAQISPTQGAPPGTGKKSDGKAPQDVNKLINQFKQVDGQLKKTPNDQGLINKITGLENQIRQAGGTPPARSAPNPSGGNAAQNTAAQNTAAQNTANKNPKRSRKGRGQPAGGGGGAS